MVVELMEGVVKLLPVPRGLPPLATLYQVNTPPEQPVALSGTVPGPQRDASVPTGTAGTEFTVAITSILGPSHPVALVQDTQYEVDELRLGVVKGLPVPT